MYLKKCFHQDKAEGGVTETVDLTGLFTEFSILSLEVIFQFSLWRCFFHLNIGGAFSIDQHSLEMSLSLLICGDCQLSCLL